MAVDVFTQRNSMYGPLIVKALEKRHFEAYYCPTKEEAVEKVMSLIPKGDLVGWGGSTTLKELGILDRIYAEGYDLIDRRTAKTFEERQEIGRRCLLVDTYLSSSNAITEDGQLLNIDGLGNRVAAITFGPKNVIIVAGINKVVRDLDCAMARIKTIAGPLNIQRFPDSTVTCRITGKCNDCITEDCSCSHVVTTRVCRPAKRIKVVLIGENAGY